MPEFHFPTFMIFWWNIFSRFSKRHRSWESPRGGLLVGVLDQTCLKRKLENVRIINFKQTSRVLKFVTFNMCWSTHETKLITHTCKQMDSHRSHIFFWWCKSKNKTKCKSKWITAPPRSQKYVDQSDNIPGNPKVLTVAICIVIVNINRWYFSDNIYQKVAIFETISLLVKTWLSGNWKVIGSEVELKPRLQNWCQFYIIQLICPKQFS